MSFVEKGVKIGLAGSILAGTIAVEGFFAKDVILPSLDKDVTSRQAASQLKNTKDDLLLVDPADTSKIRALQQEVRSLEEVRDNNEQGLLPPAYALGFAVIALAGIYASAGAVEGVSEVSSRIRRRSSRAQESPTT